MKDLKIRVTSEAESKEAQELFFELGYMWQSGDRKYLFCGFGVFYILARNNKEITYCNTAEVESNSKNNGYSFFKTITIQELRDMVNPVKEYLKKQADGSYTLSNDGDIEVPHWANYAAFANGAIQFASLNSFAPSYVVWKRNELPEFKHDVVNHPKHYCRHPSGIECIEITRHHDFAVGNAIKYLWRAGLKDSDNEIQDLKKAIWYIQDKIAQLEKK